MSRLVCLFATLLMALAITFAPNSHAETATKAENAAKGVVKKAAEKAETADQEPASEPAPLPAPRVALTTNKGVIVLELMPDKAPISVKNFLQYVNDGFYNGTVFHRVIRDFMIQGGGFDQELVKKKTRAPIQNEANNGVTNARGTLAMARMMPPHSGSAQFFINTVDNPNLDYRSDKNGHTWGYAVFGKVVEGMDVVDAIRKLPTGAKGPFSSDVPNEEVVVTKAVVLPPAMPKADEQKDADGAE